MRLAINGFGRIGRAIFRYNLRKGLFDVVAINDINPDKNNLAYLLKYDSTYGRLDRDITVEGDYLVVDGVRTRIHCEPRIENVPWDACGADIVIDASGIKANLASAHELKAKGVRRVIITNSPDSEVPYASVILGINEHTVSADTFLISSSICDAVALVPVMHLLNTAFGVDHGFVTTLHPWLNYQNLLDGPSLSHSDPGHVYSTYVLGRSSMNALIPKTTTVLKAARKILPWMDDKFMCLSYRVPTSIVSSSDVSVKLSSKVRREDVVELFEKAEREQAHHLIRNSHEPLTSLDFAGTEHGVSIDHRWTMVEVDSFLKLILWYDNEWGYGARTAELAAYLGGLA
jgi:glyceraldehyde 3-phosphate dehydrogenase